jgi:hypothetical protein
MGEPAHRARARRPPPAEPAAPDLDQRIGEEALHFARWFASSKFALMQEFLGELRRDPRDRDAAEIERRFCACTTHAKRVLTARGVVTALLALGVVSTAVAGFLAAVALPDVVEANLLAWVRLVRHVAAWSGAVTVVLLAARLLMDRYLDRVEVSATFLAMQLAGSARRQA